MYKENNKLSLFTTIIIVVLLLAIGVSKCAAQEFKCDNTNTLIRIVQEEYPKPLVIEQDKTINPYPQIYQTDLVRNFSIYKAIMEEQNFLYWDDWIDGTDED